MNQVMVFSDIHGEASKLEAALFSAYQKGITNYVFLGDALTDYQQTDKVIELLQKIVNNPGYHVTLISGNREEDMFNGKPGKWQEGPLGGATLTLSYQDLVKDGNDRLEWMQNHFKKYDILEIDGQKVFMTHSLPLKGEIKEAFEKSGATVLLTGHTHRKYDEMVNGIHYLNPGAIGLSEDGIPYGGTYGILSTTQGQVHMDINSVKILPGTALYDQFINSLKNKELLQLGHNISDQLLYWSLVTGRNVASVYFKEGKRLTGVLKVAKETGNWDPNLNRPTDQNWAKPLDLVTSFDAGYADGDMDGKPLPYDIPIYDMENRLHPQNIDKIYDGKPQAVDFSLMPVVEQTALNNTLYYILGAHLNKINPRDIEDTREYGRRI